MNPNSRELAPAVTISIPSRWAIPNPHTPRAELLKEIDRMCGMLVKGAAAVGSLYMRMTDFVRFHGLSDREVRPILARHFPSSRVAEILRVARASDDVYDRYKAGFFGFKAALAQCRLYHIVPSDELRRRKIQQAADRLLDLIGDQPSFEVRIKGFTITVQADAVIPIAAEAVA